MRTRKRGGGHGEEWGRENEKGGRDDGEGWEGWRGGVEEKWGGVHGEEWGIGNENERRWGDGEEWEG